MQALHPAGHGWQDDGEALKNPGWHDTHDPVALHAEQLPTKHGGTTHVPLASSMVLAVHAVHVVALTHTVHVLGHAVHVVAALRQNPALHAVHASAVALQATQFGIAVAQAVHVDAVWGV